MLQDYINLLKNGFDKLSGLSFDNCTIQDYFAAVGYEFAILALGLLYLALAMFIIAFPFLLNAGIKTWQQRKIERLYSFDMDVLECLSESTKTITRTLNNKDYNLANAALAVSELKTAFSGKATENWKNVYEKVQECESAILKVLEENEYHSVISAVLDGFFESSEEHKEIKLAIEALASFLKESVFTKEMSELYEKASVKWEELKSIKNVIVGIFAGIYILCLLPLIVMFFSWIGTCEILVAILVVMLFIGFIGFLIWITE